MSRNIMVSQEHIFRLLPKKLIKVNLIVDKNGQNDYTRHKIALIFELSSFSGLSGDRKDIVGGKNEGYLQKPYDAL